MIHKLQQFIMLSFLHKIPSKKIFTILEKIKEFQRIFLRILSKFYILILTYLEKIHLGNKHIVYFIISSKIIKLIE